MRQVCAAIFVILVSQSGKSVCQMRDKGAVMIFITN